MISEPPTPIRISTITATGSVGTPVNLQVLFDNIHIIGEHEPSGLTYIEYAPRSGEKVSKGIPKKKRVAKKTFSNQATCILRLTEDGMRFHPTVKIFINGSVQQTGLKNVDQGKHVVDDLIEIIRGIHKVDDRIVSNIDDVVNTAYRVQLINSDMRMGFDIRRDRLHNLMLTKYGIVSSFESSVYPGVKLGYYTTSTNPRRDGKCYCTSNCCGKGTGQGDGDCRRVTISVFASGCVILTGGNTNQQITDAYDFIVRVVKENEELLKKPPLPSVNNNNQK